MNKTVDQLPASMNNAITYVYKYLNQLTAPVGDEAVEPLVLVGTVQGANTIPRGSASDIHQTSDGKLFAKYFADLRIKLTI